MHNAQWRTINRVGRYHCTNAVPACAAPRKAPSGTTSGCRGAGLKGSRTDDDCQMMFQHAAGRSLQLKGHREKSRSLAAYDLCAGGEGVAQSGTGFRGAT